MARLTEKQIDTIFNEINKKLEKYNLKAKFWSPWISPGLGLSKNGESGITYDRVFSNKRDQYDAMCRFLRILNLIEEKDFRQDEIGRLFEIAGGSYY